MDISWFLTFSLFFNRLYFIIFNRKPITMNTNRTIKMWAEDDRPREKMLLKGRQALSDAELIAILLGSGTAARSALEVAQDILGSAENNLHKMGQMTVHDFKKCKGVGDARAVTLCAAIELGRRRQVISSKQKTKITSSTTAFELLRGDLADLVHEEFYVLYLNRGNFVIDKKQLSIGGMAGTVADGKIIFKAALELNACGIILAHNHPSGNKQPSEQDKRLTRQLKEFGKLVEIEVLDHLIVTADTYYSFADEGIL